jgi:hypothetical protein
MQPALPHHLAASPGLQKNKPEKTHCAHLGYSQEMRRN